MNEQEKFWAGEFGDAYTSRNRVDWRARIPFWREIMKFTGARSVYEVGCNAGWNLSAIREASPHKVEIGGCDLNGDAALHGALAGLDIVIGTAKECMAKGYEVIFTAGVLIHVAPENLRAMMQQLIDASAHWVLAIEYAADSEEMIEYRGEKDRLWKRNYGALYEQMGLKMLRTGDAEGFDRCTFWLMSKPWDAASAACQTAAPIRSSLTASALRASVTPSARK